MGDYDDIINLPHHVSKVHPRLSTEQRAAQFAPFAALTGYGDEVKEASRLTEDRIDIDEEEIQKIDLKLQEIKSNLKSLPKVTITYFIPDLKKSGGEYVTKIGNVKKIDEFNHKLILEDKTEINISEIIEIL